MQKKEIINYIRQTKVAEIADLQIKYGITYKDAKTVIGELLDKGELVYAGEVTYNYVGKPEEAKARRSFDKFRDGERRRGSGLADDKNLPRFSSLREYLEFRRMKEDEDNDENDDDGEEDGDEEDDANYSQMSDDELRRKALKLCIQNGKASVSMFQSAFHIGYGRACELIVWMKQQRYISPISGPFGHVVFITEKEFEEQFPSDSDGEEEKPKPVETDEELKAQARKLSETISRIMKENNMQVSSDVKPSHNLWTDDNEFDKAVELRMKRLINSNRKMGRHAAVKKAENYLEAVRDTHDGKMVQVYERLVYDLKNTSNYTYDQLKKKYLD